MSAKRTYSVIVTPDKDVDKFSTSSCDCASCRVMKLSQLEWDTFVPTTHLQYRMKNVIKKLEKKYKNN